MSLIILGLICWGLYSFITVIWKLLFGKNESNVEEFSEEVSYSPTISEPLIVQIHEEVNKTEWYTQLYFDEDDPTDWDSYHGQKKLKEFVQLQIDVIKPLQGLKLLFIAEKGSGKTTLFRIIGSKLMQKRPGGYIEVTPAMLRTKKKVDELMSSLVPQAIVCIDEIHMLSRDIADTFLPAIEDGIYPFDSGMKKLPGGITWIGATTDVGLLPEAFQDRFHLLSLEHLQLEDLISILKDQRFSITNDAATKISTRSIGSPRELKRVFGVAQSIAIRDNVELIDSIQANEAFRLLDLDKWGLYEQDRRVLVALHNHPKYYALRADGTRPKRYAHSERAIRALTGLDESLYRDQIEPKLLRQGFLTIGTGGRELTDKSFEVYFN